MFAVVGSAALAVLSSCRGAPTEREKQCSTIRFSGYDWFVKSSGAGVWGPGPNAFSDSAENVEVDAQGRLHLRIQQREGKWTCAEVVSKRSFGYGTYHFDLDSPAGALDPQTVLGLFTWSDAPEYAHREIDVEISRWADPKNENAQFVVQPHTEPGHLARFDLPPALAQSTHLFTWTRDRVLCRSLRGHRSEPAAPADLLFEHTFTQGVPVPGDENARMNLWLFRGQPPTDGREAEVVISKFQFTPAQ